MILSLQSCEKNMYADRARFGALGSFFPFPFGAFSAFSAALRCIEDDCQHPPNAYKGPADAPQTGGVEIR